jgi:ketosteroid isomerase-like protein
MKSGFLFLVLVLFSVCFANSASSQTSTRDTLQRRPLRHRRVRAPWRTEAPRLIRAVLDAQAAAWNRGDLEGYMDGYDRSPNTEFVGGDTINRGWQAVLDRYKKSYNSREKMGVLTFSELEITVLSKDAALVLGRWRLRRANDEPHGTFSLLFRKTKAGWRIVHDHSSSA